MQDKIIVKGARANNLKNIDVTIPRDKLVVMTGLSGSGKSSLAFDTIYAEGQRRYVESLSSYARMFLGQMDKPDVDYIEGLSPAISIDQKTTSKNPRSTVGTVTEIYDYLRLLWARVGTPHCPKCGKEIRQQTIDQIIDQVLSLPEGTRIQVMAPVIRGKKGEHAKIFEDAKRSGYVRARVDGNLYELDEEIKLEKNKKHTIEIVVDRLIIRPDIQQRLTDSVETASGLTGGLVVVNLLREERDLTFSQNYACEDCGISIEELTPRMFSFNNPFGACPTCTGLGSQLKVDPELIVPDKSLSILEGAIQASGWNNIRGDGISRMYFDALAKKYHFSLTDPWETLPEDVRSIILYGTGGEKLELHYDQPRGKGVLYQPFEGICNNVERRYKETQSDASKRELEELMAECPCPTCKGKRLKKESLAVTVGDKDIDALTSQLKAFDGIDPEKAKAALETVANLDAGKLIDAGKVDDLKMEIKKSYDGKISDLEKALADSKKDSADRLAAKEASIRTLLVKGIFDSSAFLKDKTVLPSDVAYASFGRHFEVKEENGELRVVATMNGQPIFSRSDPGTFAAPEEALEAIIDKYPMKDRILKAPDGGSGSHPNSAYAPGAKIIPKGDMSTFGANLEAIAKGEVTVAAQ